VARSVWLGAVVMAALAPSGCASSSGGLTELVVLVQTDLRVPDQIDAISLEVMSPSGQMYSTRAERPNFSEPVGISLRYAGGNLSPLRITAIGELARAPVVATRAQTTFVYGERRLLVLYLSSRCIGVVCAERTETCHLGACRSSVVSASALLPWTGTPPPLDGGFVGIDGGTMGDASVDGSIRDAGPIDAPVWPDSGPCTCGPSMACCAGMCVPIGCDDGVPCTTDYCSPTGCAHSPAPSGASCTDGLYCTGADTCESGACVPRGSPCPMGTTCNEVMDWCEPCTGSGCTLNDTCATAIDVSAGGTFTGTTCDADDTIALACNLSGTPDVFYTLHGTGGSRSYRLTISSGFFLADVMTDCSPGGMVCTMTPVTANVSGTVSVWTAIERAGGGCGSFTLTVAAL